MYLEGAIKGILIFITGLCLPVLLLLIINFTGYSEIVEEVAKALVILILVMTSPRPLRIPFVIFFGFLFGLSESVLYLNNILQSTNLSLFWQRFLTAVPMHIITALIIFLFTSIRKYFVVVGVIVATIVHLWFNSLISLV